MKVRTETEPLPGSTHHVHFNRGAAASQECTRRFGDKSPEKVGPAAFDWLSRGAAEAIARFIGRATGPGWGLRMGAYEFTDDQVLRALKEAAARKADVKILYHLGEFMRLYRHFAFRDWLSSQPRNKPDPTVPFLDEKDQWWKGYFGTSFASRQRQYFAG